VTVDIPTEVCSNVKTGSSCRECVSCAPGVKPAIYDVLGLNVAVQHGRVRVGVSVRIRVMVGARFKGQGQRVMSECCAAAGVVPEPSSQVPEAGEAAGEVSVAGVGRASGVVQRHDARPLPELPVRAPRAPVLPVRRAPVDAALLPARHHLQLLAGGRRSSPVHGDGRARRRELTRRAGVGERRLRGRTRRRHGGTRTRGGRQRNDRSRRTHGSDGHAATHRHGHGLQPQPGQLHAITRVQA